jgi:cobyrinic acid a,c-diamide synthase
MYLLDSLLDGRGRRFPMAGVFPARAVMGERMAALGYREVSTLGPSCLGPAGVQARGHEFHYSRLLETPPDGCAAFEAVDRRGRRLPPAGLVQDGVLGSYLHLHLSSNPELASAFVRSMVEAKQNG